MTDFSLETIDLSDFAPQSVTAIGLTPEQTAAALAQSQSVIAPQRWQTYLNSLADLGLAQWLQERAPQMSVQQLGHGLWLVNGFRVRSIVAVDLDEVLIPQTTLTPDMAAHLYVAIVVQEEIGQVEIAGSLRFDQLQSQTWPIADEAYCVAGSIWAHGSNQLLLNLRCADPASIPLPSIASVGDRVTNTAPQNASTQNTPTQLAQSFTNVSRWLNRQIDAVAAELSWVLMPPFAMETAMRSRSATPAPEATLAQILQTITQQGIILPSDQQSAYQDLAIADPGLRVYATIGTMPDEEWSLLIVLGTQSGTALPANVQLTITDGENILFEQMVEVARSQSYLYAQVIGAMAEGFQVSILLPDGTTHILPEFVYRP